ncbi:ABC transporter ATP-binding protein [Rhodobacter sp. Har01]|uniref:ABC transporter ATP-binding protein n=1 Tax=Rhodobacter sp. Har01 TaxID=2883999 RepID=UPI001D076A1B|nr:ABC transporter ATP-binding protein [Rhodobacter sp. Har01]MCB6178373.1 ABC transporter ATP-binding protein [Rhodobacter sp. Har01]
MIELVNLSKTYRMSGVTKTVLHRTSMRLPRGRTIGLVGRNGAGKSTLLRMIAGTQAASSGEIRLHGSVSWPVGFAGSFHPDLSGAQNARFVARIYGVDSDELIAFAEDFAELGAHFRLPVRTYSSGMVARLAFALSMGIAFDCYLVDEVTAVGDAGFRTKSDRMFRARMQGAGGIVVNHSDAMIRDLCDGVLLLEDGHLTWFEDVAEGLRQHQRNMAR